MYRHVCALFSLMIALALLFTIEKYKIMKITKKWISHIFYYRKISISQWCMFLGALAPRHPLIPNPAILLVSNTTCMKSQWTYHECSGLNRHCSTVNCPFSHRMWTAYLARHKVPCCQLFTNNKKITLCS